MPQRPTSSLAACVWIPLFPLRCEEARREGLATHPTALLAPDLSRKLWQVSPLARHTGVRPGMTVSQAIGLCPTLRLCEPDPVHYDERFASLLAALNEISPVVESGELGLAYLGTDGLEGIYGTPGRIVEVIKRTMESWNVGTSEAGCPFQRSVFPSFRLGWAKGNSRRGLRLLARSRVKRSSSLRGERGSSSPSNQSPCSPWIPTRIAACGSSASAPLARSPRCRKKR